MRPRQALERAHGAEDELRHLAEQSAALQGERTAVAEAALQKLSAQLLRCAEDAADQRSRVDAMALQQSTRGAGAGAASSESTARLVDAIAADAAVAAATAAESRLQAAFDRRASCCPLGG